MKEIIDLVLFALIISGLLLAMLYYAIKETEEARELTREFIKEYYEQLEEQKKTKDKS